MTNDQLKNNFSIEINEKTISRTARLITINLIISSIYVLIAASLWIKIFYTIPASIVISENGNIFRYLFTPAVLFTVSIFNILSLFLNLRGTQILKTAVTENDATAFNSGYKKIYKAGICSLITAAISLLQGIVSSLLFYK